jgi:hypothetical protein
MSLEMYGLLGFFKEGAAKATAPTARAGNCEGMDT